MYSTHPGYQTDGEHATAPLNRPVSWNAQRENSPASEYPHTASGTSSPASRASLARGTHASLRHARVSPPRPENALAPMTGSEGQGVSPESQSETMHSTIAKRGSVADNLTLLITSSAIPASCSPVIQNSTASGAGSPVMRMSSAQTPSIEIECAPRFID